MDELDELRLRIAKAKYTEVALRACMHDPECGVIEEMQAFHEDPDNTIDTPARLRECLDSGTYFLWLCYLEQNNNSLARWKPVKDWMRNIADAWKLVEECENNLIQTLNTEKPTRWLAQFWVGSSKCHEAIGNTAPEAICRAYLAWKEAQS